MNEQNKHVIVLFNNTLVRDKILMFLSYYYSLHFEVVFLGKVLCLSKMEDMLNSRDYYFLVAALVFF